jgi:transcriptional regulator with XRE-family HTH domain
MEFHEKLQELRKNRGLTQEELAEALYVSRTAISKWESGRGFPSIDSLKEISNYFSISIDDLLSTEKILSIAKRENQTNLQNMCNLLFGMVDISSFLLIVLPLYPNTINGFVYAVNLLSYTAPEFILQLHWILFILNIVIGMIELKTKNHKRITNISMIFSMILVLFLIMVKESYAITLAFILLIVKGMLLLKCNNGTIA